MILIGCHYTLYIYISDCQQFVIKHSEIRSTGVKTVWVSQGQWSRVEAASFYTLSCWRNIRLECQEGAGRKWDSLRFKDCILQLNWQFQKNHISRRVRGYGSCLRIWGLGRTRLRFDWNVSYDVFATFSAPLLKLWSLQNNYYALLKFETFKTSKS